MKQLLEGVFFGFLTAGAIIAIGTYALSLPEVHWSHTQDRCVKVLSMDDDHTCDNLPEKYTRIWVQ